MRIEYIIISLIFVVSIFFTDGRIHMVNLLVWFFSILVAEFYKNSNLSNSMIVFYIFLLLISYFIEVMFSKIAIIEERKFRKNYWISFGMVFAFWTLLDLKIQICEFDLFKSTLANLALTWATTLAFSELIFIYICVPIALKYAKRKKVTNPVMDFIDKRSTRGSHYLALTISNYPSRTFLCNDYATEKIDKREKKIIEIEAIRVPVFDRIIIPKI